jgi:DUF4097 and DUF4098 domain-containing protein YvlB
MTPERSQPCCRRSIVNGQENLVIETSSGQRITLSTSSASVLLEDARGNTIRLDSGGITISSAASVAISAPQIAISASAIAVDAPLVRFNGVVQAETVIAASIVPGASNIW